MTLNDEEVLTLWLGAVRYYLGRQSYAVGDMADLLVYRWHQLPHRTRDLIQRDVDAAFSDADCGDRSLGAECDRRQWARVRELWQ